MHSAPERKQTPSPPKYPKAGTPLNLSYIPPTFLGIGTTRLSYLPVDSWMLLGGALQATSNVNPHLRTSALSSQSYCRTQNNAFNGEFRSPLAIESHGVGAAKTRFLLSINSAGAPSGPFAAVFVPSPESGRSNDHDQFKKTVS